MKKYKGLQEIKIYCGVYDYTVNVAVCASFDIVRKYVRFKFEEPTLECRAGTERGLFFYKKNFAPILWLPGKPKTAREHSTLSHEAFHAVVYIMQWAGVVLANESEEAFAHLQAFIVYEILSRIK